MTTSEKAPRWQVKPKLRANARALRRDFTDAERKIWFALRAHRFQNARFRRQKPIGPYIVDFVCVAAKLVIEIDGGQHFEAEHLKRDTRRDVYLQAQGYLVLRFTNLDVLTNLEGVLTIIAAALEKTPSLTLPRKRERGQVGAMGGTQ